MGQDLACPSLAPWPTLTAATSTTNTVSTAASASTCASQPAPLTTGSTPRIELPHARPRHRNQSARRAQPNQNDYVRVWSARAAHLALGAGPSPAVSTRMDRASLGSAAATPLRGERRMSHVDQILWSGSRPAHAPRAAVHPPRP